MQSRELSNGFANRFLFVWAESVGLEPFPQTTGQDIVNALANRVAEVVAFAKGKYPAKQNTRCMSLSPSAASLYRKEYLKLRRPAGGDRIRALLERQAPYALRLAMLFALSDKMLIIQECHLRAALAWVKYAADSVRFIFSEQRGAEQDEQAEDDARVILAFLRERASGATLTEINNDAFGKRASSDRIQKALRILLTANPPRIVARQAPRTGGGPGKPRQIFTVAAELADLGEIETPRGLEQDSDFADLGGDSFSRQDAPDLIPPISAKSESGSGLRAMPNSAISAKSAPVYEKPSPQAKVVRPEDSASEWKGRGAKGRTQIDADVVEVVSKLLIQTMVSMTTAKPGGFTG